MKLMFLGSGSAFTVGADNFQSNLLLINDQNRKLLIDCGSDIRHSIHYAGFSHLDLTDIYISHIHADHTGGLEYVGFSTKFDFRCSRPKLYLSENLVKELWDNSLAGSMRSIQGEVAELETYFEIQKITKNDYFIWENIKFQMAPTVHITDKYDHIYSYGLFFQLNGIKVFFTTDTQFCPELIGHWYDHADLIFHDCETTKNKTGVHAHYEDLLQLPIEIKNKIWLYHYQPGKLPDAQLEGFCGFVKRGQIFDFNDFQIYSQREGIDRDKSLEPSFLSRIGSFFNHPGTSYS